MTDPHELDEAVVEDSDAWGTRQRVGAFLAPAALLGIWFAPFPLTEVQHHLLAIFVATVVLWVTETLPVAVTALLVPPVMAIAGIAKPKELFAPLADPILFIFIGGFMIAKAMTRHGLDRRIALSIVGLRAVGNDGSRVRLAFMGTATLLSMWMSNTATTALLMPILLGVVGTKRSKDAGTERAAVGSLVCLAYACSLGGLGTPVGSPPNLIALRYIEGAHIHRSFLSWMKIGIPSAIACT
ncbi:MAG: anion permease, partial [Myxococcales bacterium]|nr:anion permease [Myxococcales bacterium]